MASTRDVREKARKLRRLMASPNPHEAALAGERFAAYMTRHRLKEDDLRRTAAADAVVLPPEIAAMVEAATRVRREWEARIARDQAKHEARMRAIWAKHKVPGTSVGPRRSKAPQS